MPTSDVSGSRIRSAIPRDETFRQTPGGGALPSLTWTADDTQLLTVIEGAGWQGLPTDMYVSGALVTITGDPEDARFDAAPGYPFYPIRECYRPNGSPVYANYSVLAVDGSIYVLWLATGGPWGFDGDYFEIHPNGGAKLIHSPDNGRTWYNQDGSTPVVFEKADQQSARTMVFWNEPDGALGTPSFVQMGQDYRANTDGYVYLYAGNGGADASGAEGQTVFRVPKDRVLDRAAYEYFAGREPDGGALWTPDLAKRAVAHSFPPPHPAYGGWNFGGVVYNEPLGVFVMAGWVGGFIASEFWHLIEPELPKNVLGLWTSPNPWGPWTQVVELDPWYPGGDYNAKVVSLAIAPKWISHDGTSLWLVWCDLQHTRDYRPEMYKNWYYAATDEEANHATNVYRWAHPNTGYNAQRIDLVLE